MTFIQPAASHFINGRYVDDTNGPVLELIYPANGQLLGQLHAATPAIVEEALASAKPVSYTHLTLPTIYSV